MISLPPLLGGTDLIVWRLDVKEHSPRWDNGEGAYRVGGRWNSRGVRAVYCCLDPATAILEVAVHKGFEVLDTVPHVLTSAIITDPTSVHVVDITAIPNANWLRPGVPGAGQQRFGDDLLARHPFILIPSAVSNNSWNLVFGPHAAGSYVMRSQDPFALDTRLHPASGR